jgi:hypothetical protein
MPLYSGRMEIHIDKNALADQYKKIGQEFLEVDRELRSQFTSSDVQVIKPEAKRALSAIGVELNELGLEKYSQSIADNLEFKLELN